MNKSLLYIGLFFMIALAACKKDDSHPFNQSPNDRMQALLDSYQSTFVNAQYGWRAVVFPDSGKSGGYSFYWKFTNANRVTMLADIYPSTLDQSYESSYRMKGLQQPALIFDTYSYLHILSDPNSNVNGGTMGKGLMSDFEFAVDTVTKDSVKLTGRYNGSKAFMVPATQKESQDFAGSFGNAMDFENIANLTTYFKRLVLGSNQFDISVNLSTRTITFSWVEGGVVKTFTTGYFYANGKVVLEQPFTANGITIRDFSNINYDATNSIIHVTAAGIAGQIQGSGKPILVDTNAPQRWYQAVLSQDSYWYSNTGFTIEGIQDAYGITTIPNFYFLIFWPNFNNYDLTGFVVVVNNTSLSISYGLATSTPPNFTSDGRVIFTRLGTVGTIPPSQQSIFNNTAAKFTDPSGFYLVQTGMQAYDMVSAKDGKAWISWQY
ncbi:DUF4302 domain-containing protein [Pinibacter soli]|uniref:DUF4302 domain-containing protein n=1 Tax=Pinibacter soli TaxID=3044211 RepID=A0ABT6RIA3_9BACT|nr:DUF4302 domain-containing protein [Pinibacter soli]MDI3322146.1 DUF4302 domain-containing protein [Pinibacter soli]